MLGPHSLHTSRAGKAAKGLSHTVQYLKSQHEMLLIDMSERDGGLLVIRQATSKKEIELVKGTEFKWFNYYRDVLSF